MKLPKARGPDGIAMSRVTLRLAASSTTRLSDSQLATATPLPSGREAMPSG